MSSYGTMRPCRLMCHTLNWLLLVTTPSRSVYSCLQCTQLTVAQPFPLQNLKTIHDLFKFLARALRDHILNNLKKFQCSTTVWPVGDCKAFSRWKTWIT